MNIKKIKILQSFFTFRFIIIAGIIMGLLLYSMQTEQVPLSALLLEARVYWVSFLIVFGFHVLSWIILEKASLYDIMGYIGRIIRDTIVMDAVILSTTAACFLFNTFF